MKHISRPYNGSIRSKSAGETRNRILIAAVEEFWESPSSDIRLEPIALSAGITVQTILRHFGSKAELFSAAIKFETGRVETSRKPADVRGLDSAIFQLVSHYESYGDRILRVLAEEFRLPSLSRVSEDGKRLHRKWCRTVFASSLVALSDAERRIRLAQITAICDVQTWKHLRSESHLSRQATEKSLIAMLKPLLRGH